jgi:uncharacterized protein (DUF885 family)/predicted dienelactone hydrolase
MQRATAPIWVAISAPMRCIILGRQLCFLAALIAGPPVRAETPGEKVEALADRFVSQQLAYDPTIAYETGLQTNQHDRFADRSPEAIGRFETIERRDLAELLTIDAAALPMPARATFANLREKLESDLQLRICKSELWNVNHFDGWQSKFADVAEQQPIATPEERAQALVRWSKVPDFIDVEIANLRAGLSQGYSAPASVVLRVISQMDNLTSGPIEKSPFFSPAERSKRPEFKAAFRRTLLQWVNPALGRYRAFLKNDYLPRARTGVGISDLPSGPRCYQAFLRSYTSLRSAPAEVFDVGRRTVKANEAEIGRVGGSLFGSSNIPTLLERIRRDPDEHFHSKEDLLTMSRGLLARAKAKTAALVVDRLPPQDAVVEPERPFEDLVGTSSHYVAETNDSKSATFAIELGNFASETRAEAEITAVHEVWPGHHLQIALARQLQPATRFSRLVSISGYQEGWARYAEGLGEELGIYADPATPIVRRIWPARGMVVDPGLHAFHWTREQAIRYLVATGRYTPKSANDLVDRIAVMPGQLTAYDSGGLSIRELRARAEAALGPQFSLKAFHRAVLEEGVVPLGELTNHVDQWIAQARSASASNHSIRGVGFSPLKVDDPVNGGEMDGFIFYPSEDATDVTRIGSYNVSAAAEASAAPGAYPLVLISHGHGGSALGHHDLATYLASRGFIVAAITHPKDNFRDSSGDGQAIVLAGRPRQVTAAISHLLASPRWKPHIDATRIGVAGFSNGGYTALLLAGAEPQFTILPRHCKLHPDDTNVCLPLAKLEAQAKQEHMTIEQTIGEVQHALLRWGPTRDPRVKAAFVMAPFSSVFDAAGLARIDRPVFLYYASDDQVLRPRYNVLHIAPLIRTLSGVSAIPNAGHYVFLTPCPDELVRDAPEICTDPPGTDRSAIHRNINAEALSFFRRTLSASPD